MAAITIRSLPDEVVEALKRRAKRNSRSMEAEVRDLLIRITMGEDSSPIEEEARRQLRAQRWSVPASEVRARIAANPPTEEDRRAAAEWAAEIRAERAIIPDTDEFEDPWERAERQRTEREGTAPAPHLKEGAA